MRKVLAARAVLVGTCLHLISQWDASHVGVAAQGGSACVHGGGLSASRTSPVAPGSFLGLLLGARDKTTGQALTDLQITAQAQTFILAGYETTANALAFAIHSIASHPDVEARLMQEVDAFGRYREVTADDIASGAFPYTEAVFNEALRMYPPAHSTSRQADKPVTVGQYTVPKGVIMLLSIYALHHDVAAWPRAEEFIPERFLESSPLHKDVCARLPNSFMPFGLGSRFCIGYKFALQEAKIALVRMYQRFRFQLEPGQVPLALVNGITMSPRHGVRVRVIQRAQA